MSAIELHFIIYINSTNSVYYFNYRVKIEFNRIINVNACQLFHCSNHTFFTDCMSSIDL